MIFNLSYLTEKELEVLVEKATKKRARIIDEENTDRRNMYLFIALIVFVVFFFMCNIFSRTKFQDYLDTLDNKELELLATPYKESLISQIGSIVQAYLDKKWEERQADINFRNISKEFFYSTMPKNLARINSIK